MEKVEIPLTLELLGRYLLYCQHPPKDANDGPQPSRIEPTFEGFYFWVKWHGKVIELTEAGKKVTTTPSDKSSEGEQ